MTYASPLQQKPTIVDALKANAANPPPSVKAVSVFTSELEKPLLLAETTVIEQGKQCLNAFKIQCLPQQKTIGGIDYDTI